MTYFIDTITSGDSLNIQVLNEAKRQLKARGLHGGNKASSSHQVQGAPVKAVASTAPTVSPPVVSEAEKFLATLPLSLGVDEPTHAILSSLSRLIGAGNGSLARDINPELIGRLAVQAAMRRIEHEKPDLMELAAVLNVDRPCRSMWSVGVDFFEPKHREQFNRLQKHLETTFKVDYARARTALLRWSLTSFEAEIKAKPQLISDLLFYTSR